MKMFDGEVPAKKHKDPRREKLREVRKGVQSVHYSKECKRVRELLQRRYKARMKQLMHKEHYELLHNYQRTSGWHTW